MSAPRVLVGTAGWSHADWAGRVHPSPRPRGFDELHFIAGYFDCVEIHSTFHRVPSRRTVEEWARRTEHLRDFAFTAVVHRSLTHGNGTAAGPAEVRAFLEGLAPLRDARRLGALLLRFPGDFADSPDARRRLARLTEWFSPDPVAFEIPHPSFGTPDAAAFLAALRPAGYVRIEGALDAAVERVRRAEPPCFAIAGDPADALRIRSRLLGRPVPVPPDLLRACPDLASIAAPPTTGVQGELF